MKLLFENWRQYLKEVSFSDAKEILNSKRTLKIIKAYRYDKEQEDPQRDPDYAGHWNTQHRNFKNYLLDAIPNDITDNQKGTSVLWLIKLSRENPEQAARFINGRIFAKQRSSLETFFHHQRFMPRPDLMQIKSMEDLEEMTDAAKEEIEAHRQTQINSPDMIKEGTIFLRGGWYQPTTSLKGGLSQEEELETVPENGWVIMEIHNKAASCFHGTADWCTAAPGLKYFEEYYEPDDPLFIFQQKKYIQDDVDRPPTSYQFHYGSEQFMDAYDRPVSDKLFKELHDLLVQTGASEKYLIIKIHNWNEAANTLATKPETLAAMADNPDMPESALTSIGKHPNTPLETLEKLAKFDNKYIRRSVQTNSALDMGLAIELFVDNPNDVLIYDRGIRDLVRFVGAGDITTQVYQQIIDKVAAERGDKPPAFAAEAANLESMHEHKIKIRITR